MPTAPLLTIAIPTYKRAFYLEQNLRQLREQLQGVAPGVVQVLVSDNCSPDDTPEVVEAARAAGLTLDYIRNPENLGWGPNFAQCFDRAAGKYVLILGDDDLLIDGALHTLLERLSHGEYGVVCLRPYGFDYDFRAEYPGGSGNEIESKDGGEFLCAIGALMTLISSCIVNKHLLPDVDTRDFSSSNLSHLHLVLRAALLARSNLFINRYMVACKRNNSSAYGFSDVFVNEYWETLDGYAHLGLGPAVVRKIETRMLFAYYPFYLLGLRLTRTGDLPATLKHFSDRFGKRMLFKAWVAPILWLPRPLAIAWGGFTTLVGRACDGDLRRGLSFLLYRLAKRAKGRGDAPPLEVSKPR